MEFCELTYDDAELLLNKANGHVKSALAMHFTQKSYKEVQVKLSEQNGFLHPVIKGL